MTNPETILHTLSHPFFMTLGGLVFWFLLKWSIKRNQEDYNGRYWYDQKDEILVSAIGALLFLVWDDEIIHAYYDIILKQSVHEAELKPYYYLLVGFGVDQVYRVIAKLIV